MPSPEWLVNLTPHREGEIALICLPYAAGGTSAFRDWPAGLDPRFDLWAARLPARENRMAEDPCHDLGELVNALTPAVAALTTRPYAIFGHSMGALIGYELARRLRDIGRPEPMVLFGSGSRAPHLPDESPGVHLLPDDQLVTALRHYGATPEVFLQSAELLDVFLPMIRADFAVAETYRHRRGRRLRCPVVVCRGTADTEVTEAGCVAWRELTTGRCVQHSFPGAHFFVDSARQELLTVINAELGGLATGNAA